MKKRIDWDQYFMVQAALLASRSTCTRLSVGAVLVRDKRIIGSGYNGAVAGDAVHEEPLTSRDHPNQLPP